MVLSSSIRTAAESRTRLRLVRLLVDNGDAPGAGANKPSTLSTSRLAGSSESVVLLLLGSPSKEGQVAHEDAAGVGAEGLYLAEEVI